MTLALIVAVLCQEGWPWPPKPFQPLCRWQDGEGWLDGWRHRRKLAFTSHAEEAIVAGHQVRVEVDAAYLAMTDKCAKDFADVAVAYGGKRIPALLRPGRRAGLFEAWFRLQKELAPGAKDAGYALYYGNAAAPPNPATPRDVFDVHEDFAAELDRARVALDADIKAGTSGGRLVITDVAAERSERSPAKIVLKDLPPSAGFSLSVDLDIEAAEGAAFTLALVVDMKEDVAEDAAALKRIGELVDQLGDPEFEQREAALKELVKAGRLSLKRLEEALKSGDAEVRWRAEQAITQIRAQHPPQTIVAAVRAGDGMKHATRSARVGKTRGDYPGGLALPARLTLTINRDPDGEVDILWNGVRPDKGVMKGDVKEISLQLHKGVSGAIGKIAIDSITIRRHVDDDSRPTHALDVEETRK